MAISQPAVADGQIEAAPEDERRTSYLELFFDLVFVFAITQVTSLILSEGSLDATPLIAITIVVLAVVYTVEAVRLHDLRLDLRSG